jgi:Flp pilus assembly secretin CpaC
MRALVLTLVLVSMAAVAEDKRVNMPVGYTTTVDMPANVTKVELSDSSVVEVKRRGRKVIFTGQNQGSTTAIVHVKDGRKQTIHRLAVYVASDRYALPY